MYRFLNAISTIALALLAIASKWLTVAALALIVTIPIYLLWTWLAPIYFPFVPDAFLNIQYLHAVGLFVLLALVSEQVRA